MCLSRPKVCLTNNSIYRRFNPLEKEFEGVHSWRLTLSVISGQYLAGDYVYGSGQVPHDPVVEVEINGVQIDCCKRKTAVAKKNSLNPIWNETFSFKVSNIPTTRQHLMNDFEIFRFNS
jgi:phosphatidylinositol phospholipase C, epsilon